jgi:hypothetical protein
MRVKCGEVYLTTLRYIAENVNFENIIFIYIYISVKFDSSFNRDSSLMHQAIPTERREGK